MHNGHDNADALVRQLRDEVRRRKQGLEPQTPEPLIQPEAVTATSSLAPVAPPQLPPAPQPLEPVKPLQGAWGALDRARSKNAGGSGWPRFLRGLRRNQTAVNESVIRALTSVLEAVERLRQKFALLDLRVGDHGVRHDAQEKQLAAVGQQLEINARQAKEEEERATRIEQALQQIRAEQAAHQQHVVELIEGQRSEQDERLQEITDWRKTLDGERQRRGAEQQQRWEEVERRRSELAAHFERRFDEQIVTARNQDERLMAQTRLVEEQQRQLLELSHKLIASQTEIGARFDRTTTEQLADRKQLLELQSFIREQQKQTAEEHRLLDDLARNLAEQQEIAEARWQERAEQRQNDGRQLSNLQEFVNAQEHQNLDEARELHSLRDFVNAQERQNSDYARELHNLQEFVEAQERQNGDYGQLLDEQRRHLTEIRESLQSALQDSLKAQQGQNADFSRLLAEQQDQLTQARATAEVASQRGTDASQMLQEHAELLRQVHDFIAAQQDQTATEQQQFEEFNGKITECQNDVCARYHLTDEQLLATKTQLERAQEQIAELKKFVDAQEKQTGHEGRLLTGQQEELSRFRAEFEQWRNNRPAINLEDQLGSLRNRVNAAQASFAIIQNYLAKAGAADELKAMAPSLSEELKKHDADAFYLAFENEFRGDREEIKQRLRFYLPVIENTKAATGARSAVDLGCGRGEWLELLREHDYDGQGIDLNVCMVEECRSRGLRVEVADAITYLRALPAGSISLVTAFHLVEHLPFAELLDLFRETFRVLRPQGAAIFETPNPECPHVPSYSFYLDPTHRNPIPQELLCFCASQAGFGATRVERLQPHYEGNEFKGYLDYAGIFTK